MDVVVLGSLVKRAAWNPTKLKQDKCHVHLVAVLGHLHAPDRLGTTAWKAALQEWTQESGWTASGTGGSSVALGRGRPAVSRAGLAKSQLAGKGK